MWVWFFSGYAILVAVLVTYSAHVALSCTDRARRGDAYRVLKLIWGTATGAGGLVAIAIQLHQAGLL